MINLVYTHAHTCTHPTTQKHTHINNSQTYPLTHWTFPNQLNSPPQPYTHQRASLIKVSNDKESRKTELISNLPCTPDNLELSPERRIGKGEDIWVGCPSRRTQPFSMVPLCLPSCLFVFVSFCFWTFLFLCLSVWLFHDFSFVLSFCTCRECTHMHMSKHTDTHRHTHTHIHTHTSTHTHTHDTIVIWLGLALCGKTTGRFSR